MTKQRKMRAETRDQTAAVSAFRFLLSALFFLSSTALAQQPPNPPLRLGEMLLNLPSPRVLTAERGEVRFTHRFQTPINDGDGHSLWGIDGSADIGLGLSWSPNDRWLFSLFRSDVLDDYEIATKFVVFEEPQFPLAISLRGGVDWRTERDLDDRLSGFAQAILARRIGSRAEVFVIPSFVTEAGPFDHAFNVPVGFAWSIYPHLSLIAEIVPENTDVPDQIDSSFAWTIGLKRAIGGHYFEILLGNTRATNVDQYVPSTFLGTGLEAGDVHLGFNIERRFGTSRR